MPGLVPDAGSIVLPKGLPTQGGAPLVPDEGSIQLPEQSQPGTLEALARGAAQGVTLGFGDEISGAVESLFSNKTYQQSRDEARANNAAAQAAHPYAYGGGELGGSVATALVPGLGVAKGASLLKVGLQGAAIGGANALGTSEATDAAGLAKDVGTGAAVGGVGGALLHGIGKQVGGLIERAPEMADSQAVKALAGSESKTGAASWTKTRGIVNNDAVNNVINEKIPFDGERVTLAKLASRAPEEVQPVIEAGKSHFGALTDQIYNRADEKTGGVSVGSLINHLDAEAEKYGLQPGDKAFANALADIRRDVLDTWGSRTNKEGISLADALKAADGQAPSTQAKLMEAYDVKIPSRDVRAFATRLQDRGSDTVDRLNPGLGSQVKKAMGTTVRDFINAHVESTLGPADAKALSDLNAKTSSLYRIGDVLKARAEKEAAGRMSGQGALSKLVGHGGMVGAGIMAMHGNLPGAAAALAIPKALEAAPAVGRAATRGLARANDLLQTIVQQADAGNPWAARQLTLLRSTPQGLARLASLKAGAPPSPEDTNAPQ